MNYILPGQGRKRKCNKILIAFVLFCVWNIRCGVEEKGLYFIIKYRKKSSWVHYQLFRSPQSLKVTFPSYLCILIWLQRTQQSVCAQYVLNLYLNSWMILLLHFSRDTHKRIWLIFAYALFIKEGAKTFLHDSTPTMFAIEQKLIFDGNKHEWIFEICIKRNPLLFAKDYYYLSNDSNVCMCVWTILHTYERFSIDEFSGRLIRFIFCVKIRTQTYMFSTSYTTGRRFV